MISAATRARKRACSMASVQATSPRLGQPWLDRVCSGVTKNADPISSPAQLWAAEFGPDGLCLQQSDRFSERIPPGAEPTGRRGRSPAESPPGGFT